MDFSKIPVLKDIDLSDPVKRKNVIMIASAGALFVLLLILLLIKNNPKADVQDPSAQVEDTYTAPEIPMGEDKDQLEGKPLREVLSQTSGTAEDLFAEEIVEDPLKDILEGEDRTVTVPDPVRPGMTDVYPEQQRPGDRQAQTGDARPVADNTAQSRPVDDREARVRQRMIASGFDPDTGLPLNHSSSGTYYDDPAALRPQTTQPQYQQPQQQPQQQQAEPEEPEVAQQPVQVRRSGGVSSLGTGIGSVAGTGISSLNKDDQYVTEDPMHPFKVKFAYDEKLSTGQRVTLRLCEDMVVEGVLVPANTHLFATCTVGERLSLKVTSLNINGNIYALNLTAFDNDGGEGLYCPQSSKGRKQAVEDAGQIVSSAVQSAVSGYTGRIISSGASLIRSKNGVEKVEVTAGYQFYLMQSRNQ